MGRFFKLDILEKIIPLILILFVFLNFHPNNSFMTFTSDNANFNRAVAFTLHHEGGLEDDKADSGGITKYGISYVFLSKFLVQNPQYLSVFSLTNAAQINPSIVKNLTLQQAIQIYKSQWWDKNHYGAIKNQIIAIKTFDYSVNMGSPQAIKLLQMACQNLSSSSNVTVDGQLDSSTINFINSLNSSQGNQLLYSYENMTSNYYCMLSKRHPADKKFLQGWLQRANDNNC
jgi:lysozyme family protein